MPALVYRAGIGTIIAVFWMKRANGKHTTPSRAGPTMSVRTIRCNPTATKCLRFYSSNGVKSMKLRNPKKLVARTTPLRAALSAASFLVTCALQVGLCVAANAQADAAEPYDARGRDTAQPQVAATVQTDKVLIPERQPVTAPPLGPGDRIKAVVYGRSDLNGEYQVREDGIVSMPLLGHFRVGGMDIAHVEKAMGKKLTAVLGRDSRVNLEITHRRPFYVIGYVSNPGAFPYQIGATVLHAVAMAGGHFRPPPQLRGAMDTSREMNVLDQAQERLMRAIVRKARLEAEQDGRDTLVTPERLAKIAKSEEVERLLLAETNLMRQRRRALEDAITEQDALIALSKEQIVELQAQHGQVSSQANLTRDELKGVSRLKSKGLITSTRVFEIRTRIADHEAEARLIKSRIAQTRRAIESARARKTQLRNDWGIEIEEQLIQVRTQIAEEELTIRKSQRLLQEMTGSPVATTRQSLVSVSVNYEIVRRESGRNRLIAAEELTELLPGDILRVKTDGG